MIYQLLIIMIAAVLISSVISVAITNSIVKRKEVKKLITARRYPKDIINKDIGGEVE